MRNPLLRSTGVLSGLFYEFVIVTEADADRAFYQEINDGTSVPVRVGHTKLPLPSCPEQTDRTDNYAPFA
jgi:hypothetical protein